jgi:hypothetical protein
LLAPYMDVVGCCMQGLASQGSGHQNSQADCEMHLLGCFCDASRRLLFIHKVRVKHVQWFSLFNDCFWIQFSLDLNAPHVTQCQCAARTLDAHYSTTLFFFKTNFRKLNGKN